VKNDIFFRELLNTRKNEIPARINFSATCWDVFGVDLLSRIVTENRDIFPRYETIINDAKARKYKSWHIAGRDFIDSWGVIWRTVVNGMTGVVIKPPIRKWEDLKNFKAPDPEHFDGNEEVDWPKIESEFSKTTGAKLGRLRHGFLFLTLTNIRGFENLAYDMYDEIPELDLLIEMVYQFDKYIVDRYLSIGANVFIFPEDLGAQTGPLISPQKFRQYIKPCYAKLFKPIKEKNGAIRMHSDGLILPLIDDLIEAGLDIINMQDLVNGIDNIRAHVKGRMGIDLDIDRQNITVFGSEKDVDDHIKEIVEKLGDNELGFGMQYEVFPETPVKNIIAMVNAFRKYRNYWL